MNEGNCVAVLWTSCSLYCSMLVVLSEQSEVNIKNKFCNSPAQQDWHSLIITNTF